MKAIAALQYGPPEVLQLIELEKPVPHNNEVLIRVAASSVTRFDCWARSGTSLPGMTLFTRLWYGFPRPKQPILGTELAGQVEAIGEGVNRLQVGDQVFASTGIAMGAYAEYVVVPEAKAVVRPSRINDAQAAIVLQGALTALHYLREAKLNQGDKILILGASGGVGMYAVQLAKCFYKAHVTGVCSTDKLEWVTSLGADQVIDYTSEDVTKRNERWDVVFDTFGRSTFSFRRILKRGGTFLLATYGPRQMLLITWLRLFAGARVRSPLVTETNEDLTELAELIGQGIVEPIVDEVFPMGKASDAHRRLEQGKKQGGIAIRMS